MKIFITIISLYFSILLFAEKAPKRQSRVLHSHIKCDTVYEFDEIQLEIVNNVRVKLDLPLINNEQLDTLSNESLFEDI